MLQSILVICVGCSPARPAAPEGLVGVRSHEEGQAAAADRVLRVNHLQVKGTHNSYHTRSAWSPIREWHLAHSPLDTQLEEQGVRAIELDTRFDEESGAVRVLHVPSFDDESTCELLSDCLGVVRDWSDAHPDHLPVFVQVEAKDDDLAFPSGFSAYAEAVDRIVSDTLSRGRVITPDDVQGEFSTLREAVIVSGFPSLGEARGKVLFYVDDRDDFHDAYTRSGTSTRGRMMFPSSRPEEPIAAFVIENEPGPDIVAMVARGFIVRTRADTYPTDGRVAERRAAALRSGAQIVSTDYPVGRDGVPPFDLDATRRSRCNPITAPALCALTSLE